MKRLLFSTCLGIFVSIISVNSVTAQKSLSMIGEWNNKNEKDSIKVVKFFSNGIVNICTKNNVQIANYKITKLISADTIKLAGEITGASPARFITFKNNINNPNFYLKFSAKITSNKLMILMLTDEKNIYTLNLIKVKSYPSGTIPVN